MINKKPIQRVEYEKSDLTREMLNKDPFEQFESWLHDAVDAQIPEPNAFSLSTVNSLGHPSSRMVLLKNFDDKGFTFFTNYESSKAMDIQNNSNVAALFPWVILERQVRILGVASKVEPEESYKYFQSRPLGARLAAWTSRQSTVVESRSYLEAEYKKIEERFQGKEIPLPPHWGGYRIEPILFEFWQGRQNRLHDRFLYKYEGDSWIIQRLSP